MRVLSIIIAFLMLAFATGCSEEKTEELKQAETTTEASTATTETATTNEATTDEATTDEAKPAPIPGLETQKKKLSYVIGLNMGKNLTKDKIEIDSEAFVKGMNDGSTGAESKMTEQQMQEVMLAFQMELMARQKAEKEKQAVEAKTKGDEFLTANKAKEGVITTASGLQYKILKSGSGKSPSLDDVVTTHYAGKLIDGTKFDSSYDRGQPATFALKGVIKGWQEALQMMKEGDKWELVVPAELGYGDRGAGQAIPPNSVLVFEVELLKVEPPKPEDKDDSKPEASVDDSKKTD